MNQHSINKHKRIDMFWEEQSASDHCVQIYEDDGVFLDALEGFVAGGIRQGDAIILIATPSHLQGLERRLAASGFDVAAAVKRGQYFALDAKASLAEFMVDGWPDEALFERFIGALLKRARRQQRQVRAFGEMVALLWAEEQCEATVRLENLWSSLCARESFSLFCAYPKTGFPGDSDGAIAQVCSAHSRLYAV
jgi:hypothetical protein